MLLMAVLVVAACTNSEDGDGSTTSIVEASATTGDSTTTTVAEGTTTTHATTTTLASLPGQEVDFGPRAGDQLMVILVPHDDMLNLRAAPGPDQEILDTLEPTATGITALGETRDLGERGFWVSADWEGQAGWLHMSFVAYEGVTDDWTSSIVDAFGEVPQADSMTELGLMVAESLASEDPPSTVVLVVDESIGDLGEVTYDVIGLGDDAVRGFRVHVFGQSSGDGFELRSAEVTSLCGRGADAEGLCA